MKFKTIIKVSLLLFTGFIIAILSIGPLRSQITQIAGLAVAQTPLRWNNVKDAAVGDAQINGIMAVSPYLYNGTSLDRALKSVHGDGLTTAYGENTASFTYGWEPIGAVWNRVHMDASGNLNVALGGGGSVNLSTQALTTLLNAVAVPTVGATLDTTFLLSKHTWEIVVGGAPANQTTNIEGSINGTTWYVLDTSNITTSEMRHIVNKPVRYVRGNCTILPAGGTVTVRYMGGGN